MCSFPFVFNSNNYSSCTMVNDTQLWCSPTPTYSGQRLYCTPTGIHFISLKNQLIDVIIVSMPNSSCSSSSVLNVSQCSSSVIVSSSPDEYVSTTCSVETITNVSPRQGSVGTELIITGEINCLFISLEKMILCPNKRIEFRWFPV